MQPHSAKHADNGPTGTKGCPPLGGCLPGPPMAPPAAASPGTKMRASPMSKALPAPMSGISMSTKSDATRLPPLAPQRRGSRRPGPRCRGSWRPAADPLALVGRLQGIPPSAALVNELIHPGVAAAQEVLHFHVEPGR